MGTTDESVLIGGFEKREIIIAQYNPAWPEMYERHAAIIRDALGSMLLQIEHIGSTAVPGLAVKPIVDILAVVPDSAEEATYLPEFQSAGYELRVREPAFDEHRMFRTPACDVHIHVFSPGSPEIQRYVVFRDRLRSDAGARRHYEAVKRSLARQDWADMNEYAHAKSEFIESILAI